jgi:hypothetical protein
MKRPRLSIIDAIRDPNILGDTLAPAQEAALRSLYGLPLTGDQLALAQRCAGGAWRPGVEYREAAFVCGRRSGKSDKLAANVALYEAFFRDHHLSPGETGVVLLLAQNMRQAKVVRGYIEGKIRKSPVLQRHVLATRAQELELDNRITIAIHPSSFRAIRGLSVVSCICDEIAFWFTEDTYANPDSEVLKAVRPAMATFPHGKLLLVSSPYTMSGALWDIWQRRDSDPDTLVWRAPTALMNPTVSPRFLAKEQARDPENYRREYEAEFTEAISSFLSSDAINACVAEGRIALAPNRDQFQYVAAIDAAYKGDRFTICIAHYDRPRDRVVIDHLGGWLGSRQQPLRLGEVMPKIRALADRYGFYRVLGDQFGAEPLKDAFQRHGLTFEERTFTPTSKADIYATLRSRIQDGTIELLDHKDALRELRALELENLPGGGTRIGHPRHGRDDYADAIALAVSEARGGIEAACCSSEDVEDVDDGLQLLANYDEPLIGSYDRWGRRGSW